MVEEQRQYPLGRRHAPDERDIAFPFKLALPELPVKPVPTSKFWRSGRPILDQGRFPQCVAYAWKQFLMAAPIMQGRKLDAQEVYEQAQAIDEFSDTPPAGGTSVRAGAKVLQLKGFIGNYLWATTIEEIKQWVLQHGPVVMGTNWYSEMFTGHVETHSLLQGFWVVPNGELVGGHAYVCQGYSLRRHAFRCLNSWGSGWGNWGKFWIAEEHLDYLLQQQGEACTATEVRAV